LLNLRFLLFTVRLIKAILHSLSQWSSGKTLAPKFFRLMILVYFLFLGYETGTFAKNRHNKKDKTKALSYALTFAKKKNYTVTVKSG